MKRVRVDNSEESLLLTGMIISDKVLRDIQTVLDLKLFKSSYSKRVARWALEYYEEHEKAPGIHIQDIFKLWMEAGGEEQEDEGQMISRLLQRISDEFDRIGDNFNDGYVLNVAEKYFQRLDLDRLSDELRDMDQEEAVEVLANYRPKQIPKTAGIDLLRDKKAMRAAFEASQKPLMVLPGALGETLNGDLCRGSFLSFMGREKIGKTWVLSELAFLGVMNRMNVAFFQAGDMTEDQQVRRAAIRAAGKSYKKQYCGEILTPVYDCWHNQIDNCEIGDRTCDVGLIGNIGEKETFIKDNFKNWTSKEELFRENEDNGYTACDYCRRRDPRNFEGSVWYRRHDTGPPLTWRAAIKAMEKIERRSKGHTIKLATYSNGTLSPKTIMANLDMWSIHGGFVPDIVIIDYADLLAPEDGRQDFRHQQNEIWKALRRISQDYNCLLITATQADAAAYVQDTLDLSNFSEDKRKYAHVTSMFSLNQSYYEKVAGVMRIGPLIVRDEEFDANKHAHVLQCLQMGRPMLGSYF